MHLSDCRNDDEGYLIKKKVGELLVFLHNISLHLLLPNFFSLKNRRLFGKVYNNAGRDKVIDFGGKTNQNSFLPLSIIYFLSKKSAQVRRECQTAECRSYFEMYVKKKVRNTFHSWGTLGSAKQLNILFSLTSKILQQSPQKICWFLFPLQSKAFFGCHGIFFYKKSNICTFQGQSRSMILLSLTLQYYLVL